MKHFTVVTEGEQDRILLEALLEVAPDDEHITIWAAGGWSGADSLARSLLVSRDDNVALVVDADATDPQQVDERRRFLHQSLGSVSPSNRWRIFMIIPEIEGVLFRDPRVLEALVGRQVTETQLVRATFEPRKVLQELLGKTTILDAYQKTLPGVDLTLIRQSPEIRELRAFIRGARSRGSAPAASSR